MVLNNIEKLLEKYDNAETTLQEEKQLREYFNSDAVAPHLESYKPLFVYFTKTQKEVFTEDLKVTSVGLDTKKKSKIYQWISVAAVAVLMVGIMIPQFLGPTAQEKEEALLAYNQTVEVFNLISIGLNKGQEQMEAVSLVSDNISDGVAQLSLMNNYNKTTDKIFKTTKK